MKVSRNPKSVNKVMMGISYL